MALKTLCTVNLPAFFDPPLPWLRLLSLSSLNCANKLEVTIFLDAFGLATLGPLGENSKREHVNSGVVFVSPLLHADSTSLLGWLFVALALLFAMQTRQSGSTGRVISIKPCVPSIFQAKPVQQQHNSNNNKQPVKQFPQQHSNNSSNKATE